jgi:hypothetical protein
METINLFLIMPDNNGIVPSAGEAGLIRHNLLLEIIDNPSADRKMGRVYDISQKVAAVVN